MYLKNKDYGVSMNDAKPVHAHQKHTKTKETALLLLFLISVTMKPPTRSTAPSTGLSGIFKQIQIDFRI